MMHWWLMYKIPLLIYVAVLLGMFFVHPVGALVVAFLSSFISVPWVIFAKWVCKRIDRGLKFNGRK